MKVWWIGPQPEVIRPAAYQAAKLKCSVLNLPRGHRRNRAAGFVSVVRDELAVGQSPREVFDCYRIRFSRGVELAVLVELLRLTTDRALIDLCPSRVIRKATKGHAHAQARRATKGHGPSPVCLSHTRPACPRLALIHRTTYREAETVIIRSRVRSRPPSTPGPCDTAQEAPKAEADE